MRVLFFALFAMVGFGTASAQSDDAGLLDRAVSAAVRTLDAALPQLDPLPFGVDTIAYRAALTQKRFQSAQWGAPVDLVLEIRPEASGSCSRFAAFVVMPPKTGKIPLVLCPKFFTQGADALRELTILHEVVHVVAGPDECRAMAFAARVEQAAKGKFTPVNAYWRANDCPASGFSLPD